MKIHSAKLSLLFLTLTLVSCGAKENSNALVPISDDNITPPSGDLVLTEKGGNIVVTSSSHSERSIDKELIKIPKEVAGPILIQIITPDEVVETIINETPRNSGSTPDVIIEVIADVLMPVIETDVSTVFITDEVILDSTDVDIVEADLEEKAQELIQSSSTQITEKARIKIMKKLKTRIIALQKKIIKMKNKSKVNKEKMAYWECEHARLRELLQEAERQ